MDHIIPRAVVPELDNLIANLELMPMWMNERKSDRAGTRQVDMARKPTPSHPAFELCPRARWANRSGHPHFDARSAQAQSDGGSRSAIVAAYFA